MECGSFHKNNVHGQRLCSNTIGYTVPMEIKGFVTKKRWTGCYGHDTMDLRSTCDIRTVEYRRRAVDISTLAVRTGRDAITHIDRRLRMGFRSGNSSGNYSSDMPVSARIFWPRAPRRSTARWFPLDRVATEYKIQLPCHDY